MDQLVFCPLGVLSSALRQDAWTMHFAVEKCRHTHDFMSYLLLAAPLSPPSRCGCGKPSLELQLTGKYRLNLRQRIEPPGL